MIFRSKIFITFIFFLSIAKCFGLYNALPNIPFLQVDSVLLNQEIVKKEINKSSIVHYQEALNLKHSDSVNLFKKLAFAHTELNKLKEASYFVDKYIKYSADISILNKYPYSKVIETQEFRSVKDKYLVKVNLLVFIYVYVVFFGFFFTVIVNFAKGTDYISNILIGGFVFVHTLFILEWTLYMSNVRYLYPHTYIMSSSVSLFYGPLLYFYFKRITLQYKFKIKDLLHLIPIVALLGVLIPFYSISANEKLKVMFDLSASYSRHDLFYIVFIPKISSYLIYGFFIGKLYFKGKNELLPHDANGLFKWKRNIYYLHIMYIIFYVIYCLSARGIIFESSYFIYNFQMLAMSIMVLYIVKMGYLNPMVFNYKNYIIGKDFGFSKYLKSSLTESHSKELKNELMNLFTTNKIYRNSDLNLDSLAEKLNTTRHNTSQVINEHFDMNFFELINKFRIEDAVNLLMEDTNRNLNIIDVAYEVGFNNKVTFNKAFKKQLGLTPTKFILSLKSKRRQIA